MDTYRLVLFLHIMTFAVAAGTSSLAHFTMVRRQRATTAREALQWMGLGKKVAMMFPISLLLFFATGGYLVARIWSWNTPFVEIGIVATVLLITNGVLMGRTSGAVAKQLVANIDSPMTPELQALVHQPIINTLPWVSHMIAISTALIMTIKPSLPASLATLGGGIVVGLILAQIYSPARARSKAAATQKA